MGVVGFIMKAKGIIDAYARNPSKTKRKILIGLYVDDTLIAFHKDDTAEWFMDKSKIANKYPIKDMGEMDSQYEDRP